MTTQKFEIGQEVTFSNAFGVNVITEIKGNTATTLEKNTGMTYTKRLTSLKAYAQQKAYWNEQELAQPIHKHGDTVFATLSVDGNGTKMVWDDIKKDCVTVENLTR
jgi:ribosomal protein S6